jgi:hypothetical protein
MGQKEAQKDHKENKKDLTDCLRFKKQIKTDLKI